MIRSISPVLCLICFMNISATHAQEAPPRSERLRFDTETGDWQEIAPPLPGTAAGDLALIRTSFAEREYNRAQKSMKAWMTQYGPSSELYPQALLLSARIEKGLRNYYIAYKILERLFEDYFSSELLDEIAAEWFNVSEVFLSGVKRKLWGMRLLSADDLGLDALDKISVDLSGSTIGEQAIKIKADYYFKKSDFELAEMEYARLVREYPNTRYRMYAMRRSADAALASFGGIKYDDAALIEAEERYRRYAQEYPGLAEQEGIALILQTIREKRAAKELDIAMYYEKVEQYDAAGFYYRSTLAVGPDTIAASKARRQLETLGAAEATTDDETPESGDEG